MGLVTTRYHRIPLIATATFASTISGKVPFGTRRPLCFHTDTNHSSLLHSRTKIPKFGKKEKETYDTLQTLIRRLKQPPPLRAPTETGDVSLKTSVSPPFVEKKRLAELANSFVRGYGDLPPLRLPPRLENDLSISSHPCGRFQTLMFLASQCGPSMDSVESSFLKNERIHEHIEQLKNDDKMRKNSVEALSQLRKALTPSYEELFSFILRQNAIDGMEFLVALREDLIQIKRYLKDSCFSINGISGRFSQLQDLDGYLQSVFATWFAPGMLELRRITYEKTSASIIEFISVKEAVHPMKSLEDLRSRLGPKRRVFALFHPLLPERPLVFVHIALIGSGEGEEHDISTLIPSSIKDVMDLETLNENSQMSACNLTPKVATFYSISNGVKGLAGVGLGEFLLKQAIQSLKKELPSLEIFVTLSPIPGFRKWLQVKLEQHKDVTLLSPRERQRLMECGLVSTVEKETFPWVELWENLEKENFSVLSKDSKDKKWNEDEKAAVLRDVISKLACRYLAQEKHRGKPLDGVCKFHVGNGAQLHDVHFAADLSRVGMNNSFGMMCNYLYDLDQLEGNCANFETNYTVPISASIQQRLV
ncbi:malonyl-CoA decarboxylase [Nitzschia inconspicua]|uniref:Malonyl-CoA decarboxylase n=1 Tax=Nitzschia inconspicua TaxID=303405 RepID=A0A9K3L0C6_9STRA|nr:malonyl-CoA decarboxylase [Nitzschia inconspicua]